MATLVVPHERATTIALFAASVFLGSAAGTALLGPWADSGDWATLFRVATVPAVVVGLAAPVALRFRERAQREGP